ncbi:hypothetical protein [Raoultibacter phocaeensis]|uniref:hypothetical protein n=1 Tax=Raoultibacter phocaeensis TaxID=2479841 RepID=UPI00111B7185|nr:hypothetical protein [Raoultibacter phocaeensis]
MTADQGNREPLRMLIMINEPKLADKVNAALSDPGLPVLYHMRGRGITSGEMMDLFGLGSVTKIVSLCVVTKTYADRALVRLKETLRLGKYNDGLAFTTSLSSVSATSMKIIDEYGRKELLEDMEIDNAQVGKERDHSLIVSFVNQGFSDDVMEAAQKAGALSGTVLHARQLGGEAILNFLGIPLHEERDLILIIAERERKADVMKALGDQFGMGTKARGMAVSMSIDALVGFEHLDEE